jgi:hypothetical protein
LVRKICSILLSLVILLGLCIFSPSMVSASESNAEIITFTIPDQIGESVVDNVTSTVSVLVPYGTDVTSLVANFTLSENATAKVGITEQVSGSTSNNFTSPVTYTITASDNSTRDWDVTVNVNPPSTAADILTYSLAGQTSSSVNATGNISVTVPYSTNLTSLVASFTYSPGVSSVRVNSVNQVSGSTPNNFTTDVTYVVTAQDGSTTKNWVVHVDIAPNTAAEFLLFEFPVAIQPPPSVIDSGNATIRIPVVYGTNVTALVPTFIASPNSAVTVDNITQVSNVTPQDFTLPITYRVTAEAGNYKDWVVTVEVAYRTGAEILTYSIPGQISSSVYYPQGWISASYNNELTWKDVVLRTYDAVFKELSGTTPYESNWITTTDGDTVYGNTIKAQSFTPSTNHTVTSVTLKLAKVGSPSGDFVVSIRATDANGFPTGSDLASGQIPCSSITTSYTEKSVTLGSGAALVAGTRYAIFMKAASADASNHILYQVSKTNPYPNGKVSVTVPYAANTDSMIATFTTSDNISSIRVGTTDQVSNVTPNNFSSPVTYKVVAEDSLVSTDWIVTVTKAPPSTQAEILSYSLPGATGASVIISNTDNGTIAVTVAYGTVITSLKATFTTSDFVSSVKVGGVDQISGTTPNDFQPVVKYTLTAQDGVTTKDWFVTVTVAPYVPPSGGWSGGGTNSSVTGPGVTNIKIYTNSEGLFNIAAMIKSEDGKVILNIASGVSARTKDNSALTNIKIIPMVNQPSSFGDYKFIGLAYEITPEGATFSPAITLTLDYNPADLPENIDLSSVTIVRYNPTTEKWEPVSSEHNRSQSIVSANIEHFSNYAILGKITQSTPTPTITTPPTTTTPTKTTTPPATTTTKPTVTTTVPSTTTPATPGKAGVNWVLIIIIVVCAVIIGVLVWFLVIRRKSHI